MGYKMVLIDTFKVVDISDGVTRNNPDRARKKFINSMKALMEQTEDRIKILRSKGEFSRKAIEGEYEEFGNGDLIFLEPDHFFLSRVMVFTDNYPIFSKKQLEKASMQIQNTNDILVNFLNSFNPKLDNNY